MSSIHHIFSSYFWAIAIVICLINYGRARRLLQQTSQLADRERADGERYQLIFASAAVMPWVVMGVAQISGSAPTIWHYFRPQDGNIFVWAWFAVSYLLMCIYAGWIFFADGVKKVKQFHLLMLIGQAKEKAPSDWVIKLTAVASIAILPFWIYTAMEMNFPLPN